MPRRPVLAELASSQPECSPRAFLRAATQRYETATFLLSLQCSLDSVYLGGYVAECSLKALILSQTPRSKWTDLFQEISRGAISHDLERLRGILERKMNRPCPPSIVSALGDVNRRWGTHFRYVGKYVPSQEAAEFLKRVEVLLR